MPWKWLIGLNIFFFGVSGVGAWYLANASLSGVHPPEGASPGPVKGRGAEDSTGSYLVAEDGTLLQGFVEEAQIIKDVEQRTGMAKSRTMPDVNDVSPEQSPLPSDSAGSEQVPRLESTSEAPEVPDPTPRTSPEPEQTELPKARPALPPTTRKSTLPEPLPEKTPESEPQPPPGPDQDSAPENNQEPGPQPPPGPVDP